ncbi:MAG: carboxypeptidase-like regulatory domain-containing protein, partial [Acidobacteriota bacterium]
MKKACVRGLISALVLLLCAAAPVLAQITTGAVSGTVKDAQGGVVPGATVTMTSEARGTKLAPVTTNEVGGFVIPNVTADSYIVEIAMDGFKTVRRTGIRVSGGDRVAVPPVVLEIGGAAETVNVTAEAGLVQSQSAERSFAISTEQVDNLPIQHSNFISLTQLTPG